MRDACFMLRVYGNEYLGCEAALVQLTTVYMHGYKELYIPAYKALKAQDEGFMYLVTTDHMVAFIETVSYEIMNDKELNDEVEAFSNGNVDVVEIPRTLFNKLTEKGVAIRGYGYASIDDEGVHWTLNEKHTGTTLETTKLSFEAMETAFSRERKHGTTHQG